MASKGRTNHIPFPGRLPDWYEGVSILRLQVRTHLWTLRPKDHIQDRSLEDTPR